MEKTTGSGQVSFELSIPKEIFDNHELIVWCATCEVMLYCAEKQNQATMRVAQGTASGHSGARKHTVMAINSNNTDKPN